MPSWRGLHVSDFWVRFLFCARFCLFHLIIDLDSESKSLTGHVNDLPWVIFSLSPRIIPQATSVHYGLSIGARCAPLVLGMMYLFGMPLFLDISSLANAVGIFDSANRMAHRQAPWLDTGHQRTPYLQKGRTQILPPISPNGRWASERRWNYNPQRSLGIEHEESRGYHDTTPSLSLFLFCSLSSADCFLFIQLCDNYF